jgi:hypothetical protein
VLAIYNADDSVKQKLTVTFDQVFDVSFAQRVTSAG